ncbi:Hypothetical protein ZOBELLIA_4667 [Zobellia galactanivorans]|uniref:Uncharacterized protein n=1 Tax=Zobellia galactanivorans (strain DSM 12802 / CCUG 47099 / CIP 106680 / NCIMB 13871 / Dsij) TaxID=63186 RepID=G0L709_ZOBGA|nr:Hypothetical protein ZOBELLIA_4667 [Zobellia galactanivorans]
MLADNNKQSEVETTRSDAGIGTFLKGNGKGTFVLVPNLQSGFFADKDVRNIAALNTKGSKFILVANNDGYHNLFKLNQDIE